MAVIAQFDGGTCRDCLAPIVVGDPIVPKVLDGKRVWTHETCPAGKWDSRPGVEVCTECWLEKPCACEDGQ
ncbi:hypothetical protein [Curtobacterium sp. MCBD17_028]|uniref:hypothetical protein n=1 Tax=Curtobacterium sp. MCBD17_028 TaxID=2175670 RepID=UPI0011B6C27C|nr:hypothetical protein [Curtobacterium sp. MCBD17_028]